MLHRRKETWRTKGCHTHSHSHELCIHVRVSMIYRCAHTTSVHCRRNAAGFSTCLFSPPLTLRAHQVVSQLRYRHVGVLRVRVCAANRRHRCVYFVSVFSRSSRSLRPNICVFQPKKKTQQKKQTDWACRNISHRRQGQSSAPALKCASGRTEVRAGRSTCACAYN